MRRDSEQFVAVFEQFRNSLTQGKFRPTEASLAELLKLNEQKAVKLIKKNGLFRHSRYLTSKNILAEITHAILSNETVQLSKDNETYFKSINLFHHAYIELKELNRLIKKFFKRKYKNKEGFAASFPKTLIAYVDYLFQLGKRPLDCPDPDCIDYYGTESITEGVSYLIYLWTRTHQLKNEDLSFIDEEFICSHSIDRLLLYACQTKKIFDLEMLIDYFGYECKLLDDKLIVFHADALFDKTFNIGNILHEMNEVSNVVQYRETEQEALSLKKFADHISANHGDFFYLSSLNGYERYRLALPDTFFDDPLFKKEALFDEEQWKLYGYHKETLYWMSEIFHFRIGKVLSLWDIIVIQRAFLILNYLYSEKIFEREPNNLKQVLRSIAAFGEDELIDFLSPLADRFKIKEFLELFSWEPSGNKFLDLQYQPILKIQGQYLLPLRLISFSNLLRNVIVSQSQKGVNLKVENQFHVNEMLPTYVCEKLKEIGYEVKKNILIKIDKSAVEIDVIAWCNEYVMIMECKENVLPTTVHEMRNTLNSIKIAQGQLDAITTLLQNQAFRIKLQNSIGIIIDNKKIFTCVGVVNTMFLGTTYFTHPVKNVYEFLNFFDSGVIKLKNMESGEIYPFHQWKGKRPNVIDVENYFEEKDGVNSSVFRLAEPVQLQLRNRVLFTVWCVDIEKIENHLESRYCG